MNIFKITLSVLLLSLTTSTALFAPGAQLKARKRQLAQAALSALRVAGGNTRSAFKKLSGCNVSTKAAKSALNNIQRSQGKGKMTAALKAAAKKK